MIEADKRPGALLLLAYSLLVYGLALATSLYLVGFLGNWIVPKSVDSGLGSGFAASLAVNVLLLAVFGVQHSVMARQRFKRAWTRIVPAAAERSTYVLATALALALLLGQWQPMPEPVIWRVQSALGARVVWAVFWIGWAVVATSTFLIDHLELTGIAQPLAVLRGRSLDEPQFRTPFLYRYVRHPLYLGFLLGFWATPVMSAGHLLLALGMSVYILVGVALEERDLVARFGDRYLDYRARVGMLLPGRKAR
jgi:protein-S-isoprenylcysteine O-methyltransferase Ste14